MCQSEEWKVWSLLYGKTLWNVDFLVFRNQLLRTCKELSAWKCAFLLLLWYLFLTDQLHFRDKWHTHCGLVAYAFLYPAWENITQKLIMYMTPGIKHRITTTPYKPSKCVCFMLNLIYAKRVLFLYFQCPETSIRKLYYCSSLTKIGYFIPRSTFDQNLCFCEIFTESWFHLENSRILYLTISFFIVAATRDKMNSSYLLHWEQKTLHH